MLVAAMRGRGSGGVSANLKDAHSRHSGDLNTASSTVELQDGFGIERRRGNSGKHKEVFRCLESFCGMTYFRFFFAILIIRSLALCAAAALFLIAHSRPV